MSSELEIDVCPACGSGDVTFCNISVRPYCNECKHWGRVNFGSVADAIRDWNDRGDDEPLHTPPAGKLTAKDDAWVKVARDIASAVFRSSDIDHKRELERLLLEFGSALLSERARRAGGGE